MLSRRPSSFSASPISVYGGWKIQMDAAVEIGRNPVSEHKIHPDVSRMSRLTRDGNAVGVLREKILRRARV